MPTKQNLNMYAKISSNIIKKQTVISVPIVGLRHISDDTNVKIKERSSVLLIGIRLNIHSVKAAFIFKIVSPLPSVKLLKAEH